MSRSSINEEMNEKYSSRFQFGKDMDLDLETKYLNILRENIYWKNEILDLYKKFERPEMKSVSTQTEESMNTVHIRETPSIPPPAVLFPPSPRVSGEFRNPRHRRQPAVRDFFPGSMDFFDWLVSHHDESEDDRVEVPAEDGGVAEDEIAWLASLH
jgi:hypothetical protein